MERLNMHYLRDLIYRLRAGESERRIARDLALSRGTVHKYHLWADEKGYLDPSVSLPDEATLASELGEAPGPPRQPSGVEPYDEVVRDLLAQGCEMTAITARLREDFGYTGSYSSVLRYCHRICPREPRVTVRVHTAPGEEAQVDFGSVGKLFDPRTKRVRPAYVFVATLSYSRHQYAEIVFDQKMPTWLALHRRAFESWGGVPRRMVPDNLRAAVRKASLHDPVLSEGYRRMAQHYGFLVSPTRPRTPQHKGKVESGVHYIKRNFMAGQQFTDIDVANRRLAVWVRDTAGARIHGTTHQPPLKRFTDYEQSALLPLPSEPFSLCEVRRVKVHADCHVTIQTSHYSVPYRFVGQTLEAYIYEKTVQIFADQTLVATHVRAVQKGQWRTDHTHYPEKLSANLKETPERCRRRAAQVGSATAEVVDKLLGETPLYQLTSVLALLGLAKKHGRERLERACARALFFGDHRYRRIKTILDAALDREPLPGEESVPPNRPHAFARSADEFFPPTPAVEGPWPC
jgi:transposase